MKDSNLKALSIGRGLLAGALMLPGLTFAAFSVDGIYTAGDDAGYDELVVNWFCTKKDCNGDLPGEPDGVALPDSTTGKFWGGVGANKNGIGGPFDIFVMLEVATEITDLTWKADDGTPDNSSPGWSNTAASVGPQKFDKITGSEKWKFQFDASGADETISVNMNKDTSGTADGWEIDSDGGGLLVDQSTSLDYNIKTWAGGDLKVGLAANGGGANTGSVKEQGSVTNACADAATTDDAFYACLAADAATQDYQVAQRYEYQIKNEYLGSGDVNDINNYMYVINDIADISALITDSLIHASPGKTFKSVFTTPCLDDNNCESGPGTGGPGPGVPEPSTLALFGLALTGVYWRRRRDGGQASQS